MTVIAAEVLIRGEWWQGNFWLKECLQRVNLYLERAAQLIQADIHVRHV